MTLELSIPDALATAAQRAAVALGMSSSEWYARAVAAFLRRNDALHTEQSRRGEKEPVWTEGWDARP